MYYQKKTNNEKYAVFIETHQSHPDGQFANNRFPPENSCSYNDWYNPLNQFLRNFIKKYDHISPTEFLSDYLDFFDMKEEEFFVISETHIKKEIFYKKNENFYFEDSH